MSDPAPTSDSAAPAATGTPDASVLFRTPVMRVEDDWVDYNGHLNMAFYNVLFDKAVDQAMTGFGIGPDYLPTTGCSIFTAETHVTYLREVHGGDPVRVDVRVIDCDAKRLHLFEELYHAEDGFLSATLEQMLLHVDMTAKKVSPWPDAVLDRLERAKAEHNALPRPAQIGRTIGIRR